MRFFAFVCKSYMYLAFVVFALFFCRWNGSDREAMGLFKDPRRRRRGRHRAWIVSRNSATLCCVRLFHFWLLIRLLHTCTCVCHQKLHVCLEILCSNAKLCSSYGDSRGKRCPYIFTWANSQSCFMQHVCVYRTNNTSYEVRSLPTKNTPVLNVHFTRRNLLIASGPYGSWRHA